MGRYGGGVTLISGRWRSLIVTGPAFALNRIDKEKGYEPSNCRWSEASCAAISSNRSHARTTAISRA